LIDKISILSTSRT